MAKLVVIDDEEAILDLLKFYLEDLGHEVTTFADGAKALAYLKTSPVSLVITDMRMPGVSGIDICRWAGSQGRKQKIVAMSGFTELEPELDQLGVKYRIKKPFGLKDIGDLIASCLEDHS